MSSSPRRWDNADRVRIVRQRADIDQVDVHGEAFRRSQISVEIVKGVFEQPRCGLADLGGIASRGVAMAVRSTPISCASSSAVCALVFHTSAYGATSRRVESRWTA